MWLVPGGKRKVFVCKFKAGLVVAVQGSKKSEEKIHGAQTPS